MRIFDAVRGLVSTSPDSTPSIDDIIQAAGISRGGFYRYFRSADEVIEALGVQLFDELAQAISSIYDVLTNPLERVCVGILLVLSRAADDPEWANFILRADLTIHHSTITDFINDDLRRGVAEGYFTIGPVEWVGEFVMGVNLTGIRGITVRAGKEKLQYRHELVLFLLSALGLEAAEAERAARWGEAYLAARENGEAWWKPGADEEELARAPGKRGVTS